MPLNGTIAALRLWAALGASCALLGCATAPVAVHDLADQCGSLSSVPAVHAEVEFVNQSDEDRDLNWIPASSDRTVNYAQIPAGSSRQQPSYIGHFWVLEARGKVRSSFCVREVRERHVSN